MIINVYLNRIKTAGDLWLYQHGEQGYKYFQSGKATAARPRIFRTRAAALSSAANRRTGLVPEDIETIEVSVEVPE